MRGLEVTCSCGVQHRSAETPVGYHFRCQNCGRIIEVRQPQPELIDAVEETPDPSHEPLDPLRLPQERWRPGVRAALWIIALTVALSMLLSGTRLYWWPVIASVPHGRPRTGAQLVHPGYSQGRGVLGITNTSSHDALVQLVINGEVQRAIFVRSREGVRVGDVSAGEYLVQFSLGLGWNGEEYRFNRHASYGQFIETLHYRVAATDVIRYELSLDDWAQLSPRISSLEPEEFVKPVQRELPGTIRL